MARNKHHVDCLHLSEVVEVVLAVDPAVRRSLVYTVGLVTYCRHVGTIAVVERAFEQLHNKMTSK